MNHIELDDVATIITPDGVKRLLGLVPSHLYGAGQLPPAPPHPGELVPASELEPFDAWPGLPILDQGSWNACTWFASCQAMLYARFEGGQPYVELDPLYAYLVVTGGRNTGTNLLQAAQLIEMHGIPPAGSTEGADVKQQAARFRIQLSESLSTWPQILSAVARRRPVAGSVCVGREYNRLDAEGAMGVDRGQANHAIFLGGGLKHSARHGWMVRHAGSWGTSWGQAGFGWYTEAHFQNSRMGEAYVVRGVHEDTASIEPNPPPVTV
jgi:hypothetical protein